jgi:hypothetical protein
MRINDMSVLAGVHGAPCIARPDTNGALVVHPVLGNAGKGYAGLAYTVTPLAISAQRISRGHVWDLGKGSGRKDEVHITMSLAPEQGGDANPIGIFAYRPSEVSPEQEVKVRETLEKCAGYIALHAELSPANRGGERTMMLFGEDAAGGKEELPFTNLAAEVLVNQVEFALQKDLPRGFTI